MYGQRHNPDGDGPGATSTGHLYRNRGQLTFEDVTQKAGLVKAGWAQGVCVGDYNIDGFRDLFVTHYGQSLLYRNRGDGTFEDATERAGLRSNSTRWDTGCTFFDYDRDGKLDLAITNYLEFDRAKVPEAGSSTFCLWKGLPVMCGPRGLPFARNYLFHNERGRLTCSAERHRQDEGLLRFHRCRLDVDNDDYPTVRGRIHGELLYRNEKNGTFASGLFTSALNEDEQSKGMGIARLTAKTAILIFSGPTSATICQPATTSAAARSRSGLQPAWAPTSSMAGARA